VGVANAAPRPCAFVFVRAGDRVLVSEMLDEVDGLFYRPPGGGIEFGETSATAAKRELREEFGVEVDGVELLGVLESIFEHRGRSGHEICFVYEAFVDDEILERLDGVSVPDIPEGDVEVGRVFALEALLALKAPLYPNGVGELLR
jgi:ADP-ribose pyrophosphatase YjhB (NUDIX family)